MEQFFIVLLVQTIAGAIGYFIGRFSIAPVWWMGRIFGRPFRRWYYKRTSKCRWGIITYIQDTADEIMGMK